MKNDVLCLCVCALLVSFQQSTEGAEPESSLFVHHCRRRQVCWSLVTLNKIILIILMYVYIFIYIYISFLLRALLSSQEAPEDDPELGVLSLKKVRGMVERVFTRLHADKLKLFSAPCRSVRERSGSCSLVFPADYL